MLMDILDNFFWTNPGKNVVNEDTIFILGWIEYYLVMN